MQQIWQKRTQLEENILKKLKEKNILSLQKIKFHVTDLWEEEQISLVCQQRERGVGFNQTAIASGNKLSTLFSKQRTELFLDKRHKMPFHKIGTETSSFSVCDVFIILQMTCDAMSMLME